MEKDLIDVILKDKNIDIKRIKELINLDDEQILEFLIDYLEKEIKKTFNNDQLDNKYLYYILIKIEMLQNELLLAGKSNLIQNNKINKLKQMCYKYVNKRQYTTNKYIYMIDKKLKDLNDKSDGEFYNIVSDIIGLYIKTKDSKYKNIISQLIKLNEDNVKRLFEISNIFIKELEFSKYLRNEVPLNIFSSYNDEKKYIFTLDPSDVNIREDSISVNKKNKDTVVTVYITDPTNHFINDTTIKNEMFNNWFVENKNVTLDKMYSRDNLSLDENKKRDVIAYELTFDKKLNLKSINIYEDTIIVDKNYSYDEFESIKENKDIIILKNITTKLKEEKRYKSEYHLLKEISYKIGDLNDKTLNQTGYSIVEELKILINEIISDIFYKNNLPGIYRNNKFCIEEDKKIYEFKRIDEYDNDTMKKLNRKSSSLESYYSNVCEGHIGLNLDSYMHATTPLRNYFALINTLVIKDLIINANYTKKEGYQNLVKHLTELQNEKIKEKSKTYKKTIIN